MSTFPLRISRQVLLCLFSSWCVAFDVTYVMETEQQKGSMEVSDNVKLVKLNIYL